MINIQALIAKDPQLTPELIDNRAALIDIKDALERVHAGEGSAEDIALADRVVALCNPHNVSDGVESAGIVAVVAGVIAAIIAAIYKLIGSSSGSGGGGGYSPSAIVATIDEVEEEHDELASELTNKPEVKDIPVATELKLSDVPVGRDVAEIEKARSNLISTLDHGYIAFHIQDKRNVDMMRPTLTDIYDQLESQLGSVDALIAAVNKYVVEPKIIEGEIERLEGLGVKYTGPDSASPIGKLNHLLHDIKHTATGTKITVDLIESKAGRTIESLALKMLTDSNTAELNKSRKAMNTVLNSNLPGTAKRIKELESEISTKSESELKDALDAIRTFGGIVTAVELQARVVYDYMNALKNALVKARKLLEVL